MKKLKKIAMMGMAAMMAVSAMSMSAFAADSDALVLETYSLGESGKYDTDMSDDIILDTYSLGEIGKYDTDMSDDDEYSKLLKKNIRNRDPFFGRNSLSMDFTVESNEPNFKIWVQNLSDELGRSIPYTVHVFKGTTELPSFTVSTGDSGNAKAYNGYGSGSYRVIIENSDGENVKGEISIRTEAYKL